MELLGVALIITLLITNLLSRLPLQEPSIRASSPELTQTLHRTLVEEVPLGYHNRDL